MKLKNIYYIAEIFLPSKSAYSIHVMKMCNAFAKKKINTNLYIYNKKNNLNFFEQYNCSNKFKIRGLNIKKNNFFGRVFFALKILKLILPDNNSIIISRSVMTAILLNFFDRHVILELHHELTGLTKHLFFLSKNFSSFRNLKIIFITNNLSNYFNLRENKTIVLADGVDLDNFKLKKKYKIKKKTCGYFGSFAKGKGIENIINISKFNKNIFYDLYGDFQNSNFSKNYFKNFKNIKYKGYLKYKNIPQILSKYDILLLPYSNKVYVRAKSIETSKYMSPLKLFDYLASGSAIVASNLNVYNHILKHNQNSILLEPNKIDNWVKTINNLYYNNTKLKKISRLNTNISNKYTWQIRAKKIIRFYNEK